MSKVVILDTSFVTNWLKPNKNKQEAEQFNKFEEQIKNKQIVVAYPTPVVAELLMGPVKSVSNDILSKTTKTLSFDYKASVECAHLFGKKPGIGKAKTKFDCQIIAIAKTNNISTIYTDDNQLKSRAEELGIKIVTSKDLPLNLQASLF